MSLGLIIFDCDGVLIDSESLCDRVVSAELTRQGWPLPPAECHRRFLGLTFADIQTAAESHLTRPLGPGWIDHVITQVTTVMAQEVEPIPGARQALEGTAALGLPYRIASNSSRAEMDAKFTRTGLAALIPQDRIHSAYDLIALGKRGKPDPDLFLDAAAAEGVPPGACVVIEDSLAGIRAAVSAGMICWGYAPEDEGERLRQAGALPFGSMFAIPSLLRPLLHGSA
ncbi:MAG TPA: HAD-IA family hydrolase [Rhodopila sp.]|nr:HAD-IA family hydrolase [Rhodopila sp.]